MKAFKFYRKAAILFLVIAHQTSIGQYIDPVLTGTLELGKIYKFHSGVLNEERELWIRLPRNYNSEVNDYPVVYLLDGNFGFTFTAGLLEELDSKSVPQSIIVGILSTDRVRDFTPPPDDPGLKQLYPTAGGADNFIKMLEEELFPFINTHFRTNEFKTIIGGSAGGIFVIYSLFTKPELFNAYLCVSPSLEYETSKNIEYFEHRLRANPGMKALLYMTMGNEAGPSQGGFLKLVSLLETESPENLRWAYEIHPDETHRSNSLASIIEGFEFFYRDWFIPDPVQEYLQFGMTAFERRARRIKYEFNEDWELSNYQGLSIIMHLNESGMFPESCDFGVSHFQKNKTGFLFVLTLADAFNCSGDKANAARYYSEAYKLGPGDPAINRIITALGIDKHSLVPPVKLSRNQFERLSGNYVNDWNGNEISISFSNDTIYYSSPDGEFQLIPTASNKAYFINSSITAEFFFEGTENSPASYYILRLRDGEEIKCSRTHEGG